MMMKEGQAEATRISDLGAQTGQPSAPTQALPNLLGDLDTDAGAGKRNSASQPAERAMIGSAAPVFRVLIFSRSGLPEQPI